MRRCCRFAEPVRVSVTSQSCASLCAVATLNSAIDLSVSDTVFPIDVPFFAAFHYPSPSRHKGSRVLAPRTRR